MSGYVRFTGAFAVMAALASLPPQTAGAQATPAGGGEVPAAGEKAGAVSTKSSRVEPPLTERERELLAHVRDLEKRLSALESRLASAGPQTAQPSSTPGAVAEVAPGPGSAAQEGPLAATARHDAAAAKARPQAEDTQLPPAAPGAGREPASRAVRLRRLHVAQRQRRAPRTRRSTRKCFTGEFRLDATTRTTSTIPKDHTIVGSSEVGPHATSSRSRSSASAATSTTSNVARPADDAVRHVLDDDAAQRREPRARPVESRRRLPLHLRGLRRLPLRRDATASTSRPASSCRTSASGATTTSTTGRTSRRTCRRTRRGSSTACASRSSRPTS